MLLRIVYVADPLAQVHSRRLVGSPVDREARVPHKHKREEEECADVGEEQRDRRHVPSVELGMACGPPRPQTAEGVAQSNDDRVQQRHFDERRKKDADCAVQGRRQVRRQSREPRPRAPVVPRKQNRDAFVRYRVGMHACVRIGTYIY